MGAFLEVGAVPILPGSDYQINFDVKTKGLKNSYALVRIYYIDSDKKRIIKSEDVSHKIRTNEQWENVILKLSGEFHGATYIGIQVELKQPVYDTKNLLGKYQLVLKDLVGEAWF